MSIFGVCSNQFYNVETFDGYAHCAAEKKIQNIGKSFYTSIKENKGGKGKRQLT